MRTDKAIWSSEGANILSEENLSKLRHVFDTSGPVLIEHWYYYGSHSPDWFVFNDLDELQTYLSKHAKPGDAIDAWDLHSTCSRGKIVAGGKIPNEEGLVPKGGAY